MLAGIVQTPARNPGDKDELEDSIERRNVVLDRMAELEIITQDEADAAKAEGFDTNQIQGVTNGCVGVEFSGICQLVLNYLKNNPALGDDEDARLDAVRRGGYTIQTYIQPDKQRSAQDAVSSMIAAQDPVVSVMVEMQPGTGIIWAAAQNRPFGMDLNDDNSESYYLYYAPPSLGGDQGYQPGSTFKAFTTAAALEAGVPPTKQLNAKAPINFGGQTFKSCEGPIKADPGWNVYNTSPSGVMDMYHAAANSVNTYYVLLEQLVGICPVVTIADAVGVTLS